MKNFERIYFVEQGRKGGKIGSQRLKEKYGKHYYIALSRLGVEARKRKKDVVE